MSGKWKFYVQGTFHRGGRAAFPCEAIIESGDRNEESAHRFRGVGPVAKADEHGAFHSWYVTEGSDHPISKPDAVSVYIRVAKGDWQPLVLSLEKCTARSLSDMEMQLDLGSVEIPDGIALYADY